MYVVVRLQVRGDQANQPYTLSIARDDVVSDAAPTYEKVDGLTPPAADSRLVDSPVGTAAEDADQAATTDDPRGEDSTPWLWIALAAVAGVAVVGGIATVVVRRAR